VVNQSLVLRINICGENRHIAKPKNVMGKVKKPKLQKKTDLEFNINGR
jgi:hypothetical protein